MMRDRKGFVLLEALIAIVILAIVATTFLAGMSQVLRVQDKANQTTRAMLEFEKQLYDLETGKRPDWVIYGGKEAKGDYHWTVNAAEKIELGEKLPAFYQLKLRLSWKNEKEFLEESLFAGEAAL